MNRYERDLVLRAAFGDLEPHEEPKLKLLLEQDPAAFKEYHSLKDVRGELGSLREAPECQVSVERLRDALLKESMHASAKPRTGWLWALSPAFGLAALAVAWVVVQQSGPGTENLAAAPKSYVAGAQADEGALSAFQALPLEPPEADLPLDEGISPAETFEAPPEPAPAVERAAQPTPTPRPSGLVASYSPVRSTEVPPAPPEATYAVAAQASLVADRTSQPEQLVVIVTGLESAETGARVATETDHNEHVVFGG